MFFFLCVVLVKKRIDRTQSRLDKLQNQELVLESAHALRIERERQKELKTQLEHQTQDIQRASTVSVKSVVFRCACVCVCGMNMQKSNIQQMKYCIDSHEVAKWHENRSNQFNGTITTANNEFIGGEDAGQFNYS